MHISEVLSKIDTYFFSFLSPSDLVSCAEVCKQWKQVASKDILWQPILIDHLKKPNYTGSIRDLFVNYTIISFRTMIDFFKDKVALLQPYQEVLICYSFLLNPGWYISLSCAIAPRNNKLDLLVPISAGFARKLPIKKDDEIVEEHRYVFVDGKSNCITLELTSRLSKQIWDSVLSSKIVDILSKIAFDKQETLNLSNSPSEQGKNKRQRIQ